MSCQARASGSGKGRLRRFFQSPWAVFAFPADRFRFEAPSDIAVRIRYAFAFRKDIWFGGSPLDRPRDHFLGISETVKRGGVDPVQPMVECRMNRWDRVAIILRSHAAIPTSTADGPRANSNRGDGQIAIPEKSSFHGFSLALIEGTPARLPWRARPAR
jgi:hypothetical protein